MTGEAAAVRTGKDLRDEGIALALKNERVAWRERAVNIVRTVASANRCCGSSFTMDHVRSAAEEAGLGRPHHPNVWGGIMREAIKKMWVFKTGRYVNSTRPSRHAAVIPVYRPGPFA
jgi:hypothetical protein